MTITRNLILLLLLSFIVTFGTAGSAQIISVIQHAFATATSWLSMSIGGFVMGEIPRNMFALITIPLLSGLVTYLVFWLLKKKSSGLMTGVVWSVWLVLATILLAK